MGSATDISHGTAGSPTTGSLAAANGAPGTGARANPVAVEIAVSATGTRPGDAASKRELFSEETFTVLVFPDGGVIRLSAAVATGQLIFLTNLKTKQEVVCQVLGKRSYRPTSCYVELQFTEAIKEFWGVDFAAAAAEAAAAPASSEMPAAAREFVNAAALEEGGGPAEEIGAGPEPVEYVLEEAAAPPTAKEVQNLRSEVETLRQQLKAMKAVEEKAKEDGAARIADQPEAIAKNEVARARVERPAAKEQTVTKREAKPVEAASEESTVGMAIPWPKEMKLPEQAPAEPTVERISQVAMQLPSADLPVKPNRKPERSSNLAFTPETAVTDLLAIDAGDEFLDDMLPKPALDFSKLPKRAVDSADPYSVGAGRAGAGKVVLGIAVLALLTALGFGAWKLGLLGKIAGARTSTTAMPAAKPVSGGKPAAPPNSDGAANNAGEAAVAGGATDGKAGETAVTTDANASTGATKTEESPASSEVPAKDLKQPGGADPMASRTAGRKKASAADERAAPAAENPTGSSDAPMIAAKLLKSVPPVYPPDAMRSFITGDVTLKATVDENGKVREMQALSGPAALRAAALDALKQYQYAPATRGGKGVASEVSVTIKFWFDP